MANGAKSQAQDQNLKSTIKWVHLPTNRVPLLNLAILKIAEMVKDGAQNKTTMKHTTHNQMTKSIGSWSLNLEKSTSGNTIKKQANLIE